MDEGNFFHWNYFAYIFVKIVSNIEKECFSGGLTQAWKVMMIVLCQKKIALPAARFFCVCNNTHFQCRKYDFAFTELFEKWN